MEDRLAHCGQAQHQAIRMPVYHGRFSLHSRTGVLGWETHEKEAKRMTQNYLDAIGARRMPDGWLLDHIDRPVIILTSHTGKERFSRTDGSGVIRTIKGLLIPMAFPLDPGEARAMERFMRPPTPATSVCDALSYQVGMDAPMLIPSASAPFWYAFTAYYYSQIVSGTVTWPRQ
jgi:hypothetical protein